MIKCVIEMFGLPHQITGVSKVEVELKDGAHLSDVVAALRRKIPAMEGEVIRPGEDRLTKYYAFNINGRFYFGDEELQFHDGDRFALLVLATSG